MKVFFRNSSSPFFCLVWIPEGPLLTRCTATFGVCVGRISNVAFGRVSYRRFRHILDVAFGEICLESEANFSKRNTHSLSIFGSSNVFRNRAQIICQLSGSTHVFLSISRFVLHFLCYPLARSSLIPLGGGLTSVGGP